MTRTEKAGAGNFGHPRQTYLHVPLAGKPAEPSGLATHAVTITIASAGVVTWTAHGLTVDRPIVLSTTGALPTGLTAGATYYVANPTANTFELATAPGGSSINTSGSQSGTHTATHILNAAELAQFNVWLAPRKNGTIDPLVQGQSFLPAVQAMIDIYKAYFDSVAYTSWAEQDWIWRTAQWRLDHVDAIETAHANATLSVSRDSSGVGAGTSSSIAGTPATSIAPCTSSGPNWTGGGGTSTITATARTITVPGGNSGALRIVYECPDIAQYSINGAAYVTFTSNQVITLTTGQTLNFRMTGAGSGDSMTGTVYDNDTGQVVGTIDLERV